MKQYQVAIHVVPRKGLLDPQGKAVADALHTLGFAGVVDAHIGRYLVLSVSSESEEAARSDVRRMCEQLLANPVTEDFEIASVVEVQK